MYVQCRDPSRVDIAPRGELEGWGDYVVSRILDNFLQYFLFFRSLFWFIYLVSEPTVLCFPDTENGHPLKIEHFIVSSSLLPFTELETETNLKMPLQQVEDS